MQYTRIPTVPLKRKQEVALNTMAKTVKGQIGLYMNNDHSESCGGRLVRGIGTVRLLETLSCTAAGFYDFTIMQILGHVIRPPEHHV